MLYIFLANYLLYLQLIHGLNIRSCNYMVNDLDKLPDFWLTFELEVVTCNNKKLIEIGEHSMKVRGSKDAAVPNLKSLDLSFNSIELLNISQLATLTQLELFNISNNKVKFIEYQAHGKHKSRVLQSIVLDNNAMEQIDFNNISGLVTRIYLNRNPITAIVPLLEKDSTVKLISMQDSSIEVLDLSDFNNFIELQTLDLHCSLSRLNHTYHIRITTLSSSRGQPNIPKLQYLDVSGNDITSPSVDLWKLRSLRVFNISDAMLVSMTKETFGGILTGSKDNILKIEHNDLTCYPWWCWMFDISIRDKGIVARIAMDFVKCNDSHLSCIIRACDIAFLDFVANKCNIDKFRIFKNKVPILKNKEIKKEKSNVSFSIFNGVQVIILIIVTIICLAKGTQMYRNNELRNSKLVESQTSWKKTSIYYGMTYIKSMISSLRNEDNKGKDKGEIKEVMGSEIKEEINGKIEGKIKNEIKDESKEKINGEIKGETKEEMNSENKGDKIKD